MVGRNEGEQNNRERADTGSIVPPESMPYDSQNNIDRSSLVMHDKKHVHFDSLQQPSLVKINSHQGAVQIQSLRPEMRQ